MEPVSLAYVHLYFTLHSILISYFPKEHKVQVVNWAERSSESSMTKLVGVPEQRSCKQVRVFRQFRSKNVSIDSCQKKICLNQLIQEDPRHFHSRYPATHAHNAMGIFSREDLKCGSLSGNGKVLGLFALIKLKSGLKYSVDHMD